MTSLLRRGRDSRGAAEPPAETFVRRRHPIRFVSGLICVVLLAMLVHALVWNPRFQWDVVGDYIFSSRILDGVAYTVKLTLLGLVIQLVLGVVVALMRLSANPIVYMVSTLYVWFFRGTPLLVQLLFWYNVAALYPRLSLGIPFGPEFGSWDSNDLLPKLLVVLIGLGLHETAYTAEIVRAGILAVSRGQTEAALSVGMTSAQAYRHVVVPQALKIVIPPLGNSAIALLKITSLASVISIPELSGTAEEIYSANFQPIPLLIVVSLWYLALSTTLTLIVGAAERALGTTGNRSGRPSPLWLSRSRSLPGGVRLSGVEAQVGQSESALS